MHTKSKPKMMTYRGTACRERSPRWPETAPDGASHLDMHHTPAEAEAFFADMAHRRFEREKDLVTSSAINQIEAADEVRQAFEGHVKRL